MAAKRSVTACTCCSVAPRWAMKVILSPCAMARLGIMRKSAAWSLSAPAKVANLSSVAPATTDTNIWRLKSIWLCRLVITSSKSHGFTTTIIISVPAAAALLSVLTVIAGNCALYLAKVASLTSQSTISLAFTLPLDAKPTAIEPPIFPAPIIPIFIFSSSILYQFRISFSQI